MEIQGFWPIFLAGSMGGLVMELLRWWKLREVSEFPVYTKKPGYWFITFCMILAGGIIASLYGTEPKSAIMAVNLGASTPAILGTFSSMPNSHADTDGTKIRLQRIKLDLGVLKSVRKFIGFGS